VILRCVCKTVQEEVDEEKEQAVQRAAAGRLRGRCHLLACPWMVEGERRNAQGHQENDSVFVRGVSFPEYRQVEEHDGEQFAGFREDKCQIVDVRQAGVAKGRRQRRGNADQKQGVEYATGREYRGDLLALWSREVEVYEARDGRERGLNGVQDDREGEALRWGLWLFRCRRTDWVGCRRDGLLKHCP